MRIATFLFQLYFCGCCLLLALILGFGLPQSPIIEGPNIFFVPLIVAVLQLLAAVYSIILGRKINPPPLKSPGSLRWVLLAVSVMVLFCGYVMMNMTIFVPNLFGSEHAMPGTGVVSWLVMSFILALILYFNSNMNSANRPNLFRYFALVIAFIAASLTLIQSLILIYAVPAQRPTAFPFLAGLMTIAFIPYALLLLGLSRDYIPVKKGSHKPG